MREARSFVRPIPGSPAPCGPSLGRRVRDPLALLSSAGRARLRGQASPWQARPARNATRLIVYPLLERIERPDDLRALDPTKLPRVAEELRRFVLNSVAATGGHLSSNLGTIELTVALHYVFDTPRDRIVWDVGHQTYAHKILTGRRDAMASLRRWGGPSGFPRRSESDFDAFGTAHASTSISAALGMAIAARLRGERRHVVAVIGDGAMSAGMAFEALNNARNEDVLVVLNDNDMSISEPVGALNEYFARVLASRFYNTVRERGKQLLSIMPPVQELARRAESHAKGMLLPGTLFEELGFNYIGPVDGHDVEPLVATLVKRARHERTAVPARRHPQGRGLPSRRAGPHPVSRRHAVRPGGRHRCRSPSGKPTFTQVFGDWICDMARARSAAGRRSRRRCGRDPGWCVSRASFPIAISTSGSRSSTR